MSTSGQEPPNTFRYDESFPRIGDTIQGQLNVTVFEDQNMSAYSAHVHTPGLVTQPSHFNQSQYLEYHGLGGQGLGGQGLEEANQYNEGGITDNFSQAPTDLNHDYGSGGNTFAGETYHYETLQNHDQTGADNFSQAPTDLNHDYGSGGNIFAGENYRYETLQSHHQTGADIFSQAPADPSNDRGATQIPQTGGNDFARMSAPQPAGRFFQGSDAGDYNDIRVTTNQRHQASVDHDQFNSGLTQTPGSNLGVPERGNGGASIPQGARSAASDRGRLASRSSSVVAAASTAPHAGPSSLPPGHRQGAITGTSSFMMHPANSTSSQDRVSSGSGSRRKASASLTNSQKRRKWVVGKGSHILSKFHKMSRSGKYTESPVEQEQLCHRDYLEAFCFATLRFKGTPTKAKMFKFSGIASGKVTMDVLSKFHLALEKKLVTASHGICSNPQILSVGRSYKSREDQLKLLGGSLIGDYFLHREAPEEMKVEISQRQNSTRFSKLPAEAVSIRFKADSPYTREGEENKIIGHFSAPGFSEAAVGLLLEVFSPEAIVSVLRRIRGDGSVVNMLATIGALMSCSVVGLVRGRRHYNIDHETPVEQYQRRVLFNRKVRELKKILRTIMTKGDEDEVVRQIVDNIIQRCLSLASSSASYLEPYLDGEHKPEHFNNHMMKNDDPENDYESDSSASDFST